MLYVYAIKNTLTCSAKQLEKTAELDKMSILLSFAYESRHRTGKGWHEDAQTIKAVVNRSCLRIIIK